MFFLLDFTTSDPKLKKSNYRGMIMYGTLLASLCWAKHIVTKGEACSLIIGELSQSWVWHQGISLLTHDGTWRPILWVYRVKHQGISLLIQDGTWWPRQWFYQVQYQVDLTLTSYEEYWLVQRSYLQDFKYITLTKVMWLSLLWWTYK
jgi:hypothetical protein